MPGNLKNGMEAQPKLIKFGIVALPVGLLLFGVGSVLLSQLTPKPPEEDQNEKKRMEAASLNRKAVNRADLERYLKILCEDIGERHMGKPEALERAAIWIESTLKGGNIGYQVERQVYAIGGKEIRNVIAELPGKERRKEIIVLGAHYDSVKNCPAANDNGTGVAALLALARAMAGDQQKRTVRFAFFVNEEPPHGMTENMGSLVYAKSLAARSEKVVTMLSVETIGFFSNKEGSQKYPKGVGEGLPSKGNFLAFVANEKSKHWAQSGRGAFMRAAKVPAIAGAFPEGIPGISWSDHWSFWQVGYPALMVTDTALYRYPHYHKPTDTVDKIDFARFEEVCVGLENVVRTWANP